MTWKRRPGIQVVWHEVDPALLAPPLEADLSGWSVEKRRRSHLNAWRTQEGKRYYLKWFFHGSWGNPALREWRNALAVRDLGIPTVICVGWGTHPHGSFVVLEGSPGFPADEWRSHDLSPAEVRRLTVELARWVAKLHDAGLCQKDLNVYHVLVHEGRLRLIDVGRVMRFRLRRWVIKDLAGLLCSARLEGFADSLGRLFLRAYLRHTRRRWSRRRVLRAVVRKAERYRRHNVKRLT